MRHHSNKRGSIALLAIPFLFLGLLILVSPESVQVGGVNGAGTTKEGIILISIGLLIIVISFTLRRLGKFIYRDKKTADTEPDNIHAEKKINMSVEQNRFSASRDLYVSLISNAFFVYLFLSSLVWPTNANFIYETAFFILIMEFLAIHSSAFASSKNSLSRKELIAEFPKMIFLIFLYLLFVLGISVKTQDPTLLILFSISVVGKFFGGRAYREKVGQMAAFSIMAIFASILIVVVIGSTIAPYFTMPAEIIAKQPAGLSGLLFDSPQLILLWGVFYYSILSAVQIFFYRKSFQKSQDILL